MSILEILVGDGVSDPRRRKRAILESRISKFIPNVATLGIDVIPGVILKVLEPYWRNNRISENGLSKIFPRDEVSRCIEDVLSFQRHSLDPISIQLYRINAILGLAYGTYEYPTQVKNIASNPGFTGTSMRLVDRGFTSSVASLSMSDSPKFVVNRNGQIFQSFASPNSVYDRETVRQMRIIMHDQKLDADAARRILIDRGYFEESYEEKINDPRSGVLVCNGSRGVWPALFNNIGTKIDNCSPIVAVIAASDGLLTPFTRYDGQNDREGLIRIFERILSGKIQEVVPEIRLEAEKTRIIDEQL